MTPKQLASAIAKLEGKKTQARIGEIKEIIGIIADLSYDSTTKDTDPLDCILVLGQKRGKRKKARA